MASINYPDETLALTCELAKILENPLPLAQVFFEKNLLPNLVEPLLKKGLERSPEAGIEWLQDAFESDAFCGVAMRVVLTTANLPPYLRVTAIRKAENFVGHIETYCLRNEVPEETLLELLQAESDRISVAAAVGEWNARRSRGARSAILVDWRSAILRSARAEDPNASDEHWIGEILKSDPALASDWLIQMLDSRSTFIMHKMRKIADKAISVLTQEQRLQVLNHVRELHGVNKLVSNLVGDDNRIYQELLSNSALSHTHLAPLEGHPKSSWINKAILALDAEYSIDEITQSTFLSSRSWSGPESEYWKPWREEFKELTHHTDHRIVAIGTRGTEFISERIEQCREQEKFERIHGR